MNKNPFVPQPSFTPPQPPIPPGPPPPQPGQSDYSAYWANSTASHQQQQAFPPPPTSAQYNFQYNISQPQPPPRPPPTEQSALYANYGYSAQWQRQQQQQQLQQMQAQSQHYHAPTPPIAPTPAPSVAQPGYNPYHPGAGYPQSYAIQSVPPVPPSLTHAIYPPLQPLPQQTPLQPFPQHISPHVPQHQHRHPLLHNSPHHLPPAKRQRFDGPNLNRHAPSLQHATPPQSQFQVPAHFPQNIGPYSSHSRGGSLPGSQIQMVVGRGSVSAGRGGTGGAQRGGRGLQVSGASRGGFSTGRGRGGGNTYGGGGRPGAGAGSLRGHNSRSFGNRDYQNRREGGSGIHRGGSFRNRGSHTGSSRNNRHDGGSAYGTRDGHSFSYFSGSGKRDENRRTFTDFKIVGLEIRELRWMWGVIPAAKSDVAELKVEEPEDSTEPSVLLPKGETLDQEMQSHEDGGEDLNLKFDADGKPSCSVECDVLTSPVVPIAEEHAERQTDPAPEQCFLPTSTQHIPDPYTPSRIRIYFHTPVTADDSRPVPHNTSFSFRNTPSDSRKGKRKKLEEEDGDVEDLRARPLLPHMSGLPDDRSDVASVAHGAMESTGDANWLIAPFSKGVNDAETAAELDPSSGEDARDSEEVSESIRMNELVTTQDSDFSRKDIYGIDKCLANGDHVDAETVVDCDSVDSSASFKVDPDHAEDEVETQPDDTSSTQENFPEADQTIEHPASPNSSSNTFLSTSSTSTFEDSLNKLKTELRSGKVPSPNRLSISYACGNRRLVVNAEVVESLKVFRKEGRIDVLINVRQEDDCLKGILVEGLSEVTKSYHPLQISSEKDPLLSGASGLSLITLRVYLDAARPLSEPKWVKTGDVQDWLRSMFGRMFWVAGEAAEGWEKKIEVVDPDPPPTIWTVLESWASNSVVGATNERQRFLKTHMTESENVLEILLRLVRGEKAAASYQPFPIIAAFCPPGPLLQAMQKSSNSAQQTHVSLAVLALFHTLVEYALKVNPETGKSEVEECVGEIIRCLPSQLMYKSLDGIFKEWRVEKKGR